MSGRLDGKVAVITGATSGIGEATAEVFVREGEQVVVSGRSEERGRQIVERLGDGAVFVHCDVTEEEQIAALIDSGSIDSGASTPSLTMPEEGCAIPSATSRRRRLIN